MKYFDNMMPILEKAMKTQEPVLKQAAEMIADAVAADHLIYVFGSGHAGILSEESFYRAGGLVPVCPIFAPGLTCQTRPMPLSSLVERRSGYAEQILDNYNLEPGSVLIVHSNSGKNAVPIEMADLARKRGLKTIAITNAEQCRQAASRHPQGLKLVDAVDLVIDNCGVFGDACVKFDEIGEVAGATSTVVGAALLNAVWVEAVQILIDRGVNPPIFRSTNVDGNNAADANQKLMDHYGRRLLYL